MPPRTQRKDWSHEICSGRPPEELRGKAGAAGCELLHRKRPGLWPAGAATVRERPRPSAIIMDVFPADGGRVLLDGKPMVREKVNVGYLPEEAGPVPQSGDFGAAPLSGAAPGPYPPRRPEERHKMAVPPEHGGNTPAKSWILSPRATSRKSSW